MEEKKPHEIELGSTVKELHEMHRRYQILVRVLFFSIAIIIIAGIASYYIFGKELGSIRASQEKQNNEHKITNQFLLSTIDWSAFRTRVILYMRDKIVDEWTRIQYPIDLDEAYLIAETNVKECESYPRMDPFVLLAMQNVESSFRKNAVSPMGAIGLNQLMPSTGRLLCGFFGYSYSDSLLYDIKTSTRLSVKLLDILFSTHNNWATTMADYNGGPYQAWYYRKDKSKLSTETAKYIPSVMALSKSYSQDFKTYRIDNKLISYKDTTTSKRR